MPKKEDHFRGLNDVAGIDVAIFEINFHQSKSKPLSTKTKCPKYFKLMQIANFLEKQGEAIAK